MSELIDLRAYLGKGDRVHDYERAGYKKKSKCEHCGSTKNLIVHHKDHDHSNNSKGNHETICRTCHSKEHADQRRDGKGKYGSGTKVFAAPASATSGIQGYDLDGQRSSGRAGARLRPKRQRVILRGSKGRVKSTGER